MQVWPVAAKMPEIAPAAAASRSQSSNTMLGDLPPSSRVTRFMVLGGLRVDARAGDVRSGEGDLCDVRVIDEGGPRLLAQPRDDVEHAVRKSGLARERANSSVDTDANSDGFTTTLQPAAIAAAHFQATNSSGEFHAVNAATTPTGSCRVKAIMSGLSIGITAPSILSARPPK